MEDMDLVDEQEADILLELYRDIVEKGPDLFSMHDMTLDAPFSFVSESFYQRLDLPSGCLLGKPFESVIDPRDQGLLRKMLGKYVGGASAEGGVAAVQGDGMLVELRVVCGGGAVCPASMSIALGSEGIVVVTRLR